MLKKYFFKEIHFIQNTKSKPAHIYDYFEIVQYLPSCSIGCNLHIFNCLFGYACISLTSLIISQDIFGGGGETAATAIDWAMAEMLKDPRVMQKAQVKAR